MIAHVKGEITFKSPTHIIVEAGGIGYHINISIYTYTRIEKLETVKILTHLIVKEDSHTLYGFFDHEERTIFTQLISVSGIGPNTARILLSSISPQEARAAIVGEDHNTLNSIKGIGPKTAKRLVVELKDKMMKGSDGKVLTSAMADNTFRNEALFALEALGFSKSVVQKTLNKVLSQNPGVNSAESLIKLALKQLSS